MAFLKRTFVRLNVEIERIPARRVIKAIAKSLGIRASKVLEALEEAV